jgi:hypothetical protein
MSFKLYYRLVDKERWLLWNEYKKFSELKKDWEHPMFRDYHLKAVEEKEVTNLPVRPRFSYEQIS